jgi:hypothetical protein
MSHAVVGSFEHISFPGLGITDVLAKIDTGAYSGALDCRKIHLSADKKTLQFSLFDDTETIHTTIDFISKPVRNSSGQQTDRYLIDTEIIIGDKSYPIRIGLSDRSEMNCHVLIGRRFLRENNFLVDVRINQDYDKEMEEKE